MVLINGGTKLIINNLLCRISLISFLSLTLNFPSLYHPHPLFCISSTPSVIHLSPPPPTSIFPCPSVSPPPLPPLLPLSLPRLHLAEAKCLV